MLKNKRTWQLVRGFAVKDDHVFHRIGLQTIFAFLITAVFSHVSDAQNIKENPHLQSSDNLRAPTVQLCRPLVARDIRKKVGMAENNYEELKLKLSEIGSSLPDMKIYMSCDAKEREALLEVMTAKAESIEPDVFRMLSRMLRPESLDQLMGIYIRFYGEPSILNQRISDRLRLSNEQREKIVAAVNTLRTEKSVIWSQIADGKKIEKDKIGPLLLIRAGAFDPTLEAILTKDQRTILTMMKGDNIAIKNGGDFSRITFGW